MNIDKANVSLVLAGTVAVGSIYAVLNARTWADNQHAAVKEEVKEVETLARDVKAQTDLLRLLVTQQAELVGTLAEDSKVNRETLIKIEAKLPENDSTARPATPTR